ncbi:alpha-ketoacid dehydrogenase subunit beta [Sphaerisporangium aureirubrum]|uniref:Alpha-ketoacid dehydrogenase subunit beta n=1 Tax=Sphaerisporangium aureirubrum TaxID=1544736 RepID=A0ABW1NLL4_9ACTN
MAGPLHRRRERLRLEQERAMSADISYSVAFQQGVREEMDRDKSVFVLGTDIFDRGGHFAQVKGLGDLFGRTRVRDAPISEAAMVAAGVGAALAGTRPLVDLNFMDFAYGAMDEIANQAAKLRYMWGAPVPLVIRATSGVAQGGAQHNNSLEPWLAGLPGLSVVSPYRPYDVKGLIKSALRGSDPVIFMMHKKLTGARGPVGGDEDLVEIGRAHVARPGTDVTVVTYSYGVRLALGAAEALAGDGVSAEVIDLRTLYPLDTATIIESVRRTGRVVVLDEAPRYGGMAAEIVTSVTESAFWYLDQPVHRVTGAHTPIPHSPALLDAILPTEGDVVRAVRQVLADGPQEAR